MSNQESNAIIYEDDLRNNLKLFILSNIQKKDKTVGSIATYAIVRNASGVFSISIYWKGKTQKGDSPRAFIELDSNPENAMIAIQVMELIMKEAREVPLSAKIEFFGSRTKEKHKDKMEDLASKTMFIPKKITDGWG